MRFKMVIAVLPLLLCFGIWAFAAEMQGNQAKKDLEKFQGAWILVTGDMDGKKIADQDVEKSKLIYEGDKITVITPHQHGEPIVAEIVKIDTAKSPKQMHFVRKNGPGAGNTFVGIYDFDGDNMYSFVLDPTGATEPKELSAKEKSGHIKHTWKRVQQ